MHDMDFQFMHDIGKEFDWSFRPVITKRQHKPS